MKIALVTLVLVAGLAAAGCGGGSNSTGSRPSAAGAASGPAFYGHIAAMTSAGSGWELKFDPAWWLTGVAAERAALADTGSSDVPNDYYVVDDDHRLLTFVVRPTARVTVLTDGARRTSVTPEQLARLVDGETVPGVQLSEPRAGFWLAVGHEYPNPAVTLDQQYQP